MTPLSPDNPVPTVTARPGRRGRWTPLITAVSLLILGVLTGVAWALLTPAAEVTVTDAGVAVPPDQSALLAAGPVTFALASLLLGVVCGVGVWFVMPGIRGPVGLGYGTFVALVASGLGMEVGNTIAGRLYPGINPHAPGTYRMVESLWLSDTAWGSVPMPWLLLICAPGMAALAYLICAAGSGDRAWSRGSPAMSAGQAVTGVGEESRTHR